jgi:hypothetical protein
MLFLFLVSILWSSESILSQSALQYFDCKDNQLEIEESKFSIRADKANLIYYIKPNEWEELEKRSIVLYKTSDDSLMWKSDAKDLPSCLILKGAKVKNILQTSAVLKVVTEFPQDTLMEVRSSSLDLSAAKNYKFFGSGLKYVDIDISHVRESRMQQIYLDYVYASSLKSIEGEGEQSLIRMNHMVVAILSNMENMKIEKWSATKMFSDFKRSTQVMAKFLGLPANEVAMKAHIRGLGVGDSLQILRNLVKIYEILIFERKYFDSEKINNLNTIITNIMGVYEQEFKFLCASTIDYKLPFVDSTKMNIYEAFNFILKRVNNLLMINTYESHKQFIELLQALRKMGWTYKQAIEDPSTKEKIVKAYQILKAASKGIPSHALAQSEIIKLKELSASMKDLEIYKELFVDLELNAETFESEYFLLLREQLDLLQSGSNKLVKDSSDLEFKLNSLLKTEIEMIDILKAKTAKLAEIMSYLDEVDKNVRFVGKFCPTYSQPSP